jgi:hypothetical protein
MGGGGGGVCGHHTELCRGGSEGVGGSGRLGEHSRDTGAQVGHFMDEGVLVAVWGPGGRWNTWVHTARRVLQVICREGPVNSEVHSKGRLFPKIARGATAGRNDRTRVVTQMRCGYKQEGVGEGGGAAPALT